MASNMPYDAIIERSDAAALIPEQAVQEIFQGTIEQSVVLRFGRRLPNMSRGQLRMPVLGTLPTAYFVDGEAPDGGLKDTTKLAWRNKYINAEEVAVIVPVPEAVLNDADYDLWGEAQPHLVQELGRVIDLAVLFGTNAPTAWPTNIVDDATAAGNSVALGTGNDLYDDLLGESGVYSLVETDGYMVNGVVGHPALMGKLRGLRDGTTGQPIFQRAMDNGQNMQAAPRYEIAGVPVIFSRNGGFDLTAAEAIVGDWNQLVYAIRQDMTFKVLTEAVISDSNGAIVYNLAQQDMVALRVVMRLGWQLPNPVNRLSPTEGGAGIGSGDSDVVGRHPFAVLTPAAS